ncbi:AraC family transcriptional regulator [Bradyrhizobium sp. WYCCWR 13022]
METAVVSADAFSAPPGDPDGSITEVALAFIKKSPEIRITLRDLERQTGASIFQLIRAFRRDLGVTPHAYLIKRRVARGADLLLQGEPAAQVAYEVGFVDQSHFTKHFKRVHGVTPKRYVAVATS